MSLIWREQLSVGNDVIDNDHKYLIDLINQVETCLNNEKRIELVDLLNRLTQYSMTHFASEEKIASCAGYTQVTDLHKSHEVLLKELDQVKHEMLENMTKTSIEHFTTFLRNWLINHVIKEDLLMKPALKNHAPTFDPR